MAYIAPDSDSLQFDFTLSGYVAPDGDSVAFEFEGEIQCSIQDDLALNYILDAVNLSAATFDAVGLSDTVDGYSLRAEIISNVSINDEFVLWTLAAEDEIDDQANFDDSFIANLELYQSCADAVSLSDAINGDFLRVEQTATAALNDLLATSIELNTSPTDVAGLGDSFSCINWSEWLRQNSGAAIKRFYFTLTGSNETPPVADAVIPITSFQSRMRQNEPTYLSVVIGDIDSYAATINARSHGQMVIDMALLIDGVEAIREEIIRVDLEDIRIDEGPRNKSISLSGHATVSYTPKITALSGATYKSITNGMRRYRCDMDPYLRPGDTVRINGEEFEIASLSIFRSVGSEQMEIVEAET